MDQKELLAQLEEMKNQLEANIEEKAAKNVEEKLKAVNEAIEELKAAKPEVTAEELKALKADLDTTIKALDILQTRVKSGSTKTEEAKSFGDTLKEAFENATDDIAKFTRKETKRLAIDVKAVADFSTGNVTGGSVWGASYKPGIIMNPNTRTHVRSLMNTAPHGPATDYYFMKENGAGEGSIAPTSEKKATEATTQATGLKPQFDLDLIEASVKFETIAGFMLLSRKAMNNIPNLMSFLQSRVPEKLLDVEDAQLLYGDGSTPNIKGILASGNFTAGTTDATILVERIIDDLSLLEDTHKRMANGIVMRPADYYTFFKNKAGGSEEYDLPQGVSFVNGVLYILGIPVRTTTALTAGDYIVGDFSGADLLIQEAMRLEFFEQDGTNVRTNQVTLRIEETIALPVYGSNYFIKGAVPSAE